MIELARPHGGFGGGDGDGDDGGGSVGGAFAEKRLSTKKRVIESIINCTTPQRSM